MSEVLFILTTVFVAYVVFSVVNDGKKKTQKEDQVKNPVPTSTPIAEIKVAIPKESSTNTQKIKPVTNTTNQSTLDLKQGNIRNPETGETAKIPNNYHFNKRWIKEALVKEGLLNKIYKDNEMNDKTNAKIKQALADLQAIEKYQP